MSRRNRNSTPESGVELGVTLMVLAVVLALTALSLRAAASLGVLDDAVTVGEAFGQGQLNGARVAVLLASSAGLGWIGFHGLRGRATTWILLRTRTLALAVSVVSVITGLWLTALLTVLAVVIVTVVLRRSTTPLTAAPTAR